MRRIYNIPLKQTITVLNPETCELEETTIIKTYKEVVQSTEGLQVVFIRETEEGKTEVYRDIKTGEYKRVITERILVPSNKTVAEEIAYLLSQERDNISEFSKDIEVSTILENNETKWINDIETFQQYNRKGDKLPDDYKEYERNQEIRLD